MRRVAMCRAGTAADPARAGVRRRDRHRSDGARRRSVGVGRTVDRCRSPRGRPARRREERRPGALLRPVLPLVLPLVREMPPPASVAAGPVRPRRAGASPPGRCFSGRAGRRRAGCAPAVTERRHGPSPSRRTPVPPAPAARRPRPRRSVFPPVAARPPATRPYPCRRAPAVGPCHRAPVAPAAGLPPYPWPPGPRPYPHQVLPAPGGGGRRRTPAATGPRGRGPARGGA